MKSKHELEIQSLRLELEKSNCKRDQEREVHQKHITQLQSRLFKSKRTADKTITLLHSKLSLVYLKFDTLKAENTNTVNDVSKEITTAVKIAVKKTKSIEKKHYCQQNVSLKHQLRNKYVDEQCKVAALTKKVIHAEISSHNSLKKAATQQSNSCHIVDDMKKTVKS